MRYRSVKNILERSTKHLLAQMKRSLSEATAERNEYNSCRYRGDDGRMCALGCLISNNRYYPALEGLSSKDPKVLDAARIRMEDRRLADELQSIHDGDEPWRWKSLLYAVHNKYNVPSEYMYDL